MGGAVLGLAPAVAPRISLPEPFPMSRSRRKAPQPARRPKRASRPFWEAKRLEDMSRAEWESLCDGCGQCCMLKVEVEDTSQIFLTRLACKLLDIGSCRCRDYPDRHASVPDCVVLTPENVTSFPWLPATCAYRVLAQGGALAWWHPLVSGDPDTVHQAGISVRTWARSEKGVRASAITRYIVDEA